MQAHHMSSCVVQSDSLSDVMLHLHAQRVAAQSLQSTGCLLMIAPIYAGFNEDCSKDNHCYADAQDAADASGDAAACLREFASCVEALRSRDVKVWVHVPQDSLVTPDAHFPNNWLSTYAGHAASLGGTICVHSMRWPSRRLERRDAVIHSLTSPCPPLTRALYVTRNDLSKGEDEEGGILEGTGSLVLDRVSRRAFVARSQRSEAAAAQSWAVLHGCFRMIRAARLAVIIEVLQVFAAAV